MDPKNVQVAVQAWINASPTVNLYTIKQYVFRMLSARFAHDHVQGIIIDRGVNIEVSQSKKEGLQSSVITHSVDDWRIQWADCEISVPKPKPGRSTLASQMEDTEKFQITGIFMDFYH